MTLRAALAARLLTPLGVLVPLAATPIVAAWAPSTDPAAKGPIFALLLFAAGLVTIGIAGRLTYGAAISVATAIVTWAVGLLGLPLALVLGALVLLGLVFVVPGTQGFCET